MLIDGRLTGASDGGALPATDPYTGEQIGSVPCATSSDVDEAVTAARRAFVSTWASSPGVERARLLHRLADLLDAEADRLGLLECHDIGKLARETTAEVHFAARMYRHFAGYADKMHGRTIALDTAETFDYTLSQPLGVAALITAWNSPMRLLANKLAPALTTGNCVVVKPSEHGSLTTMAVGELIVRAGFPPGVVNIVTGGPPTGTALTSHSGLDKISFTGSVQTGRAIAEAGARRLVPVTLELGGKSPNIVFDDADLDSAVAGAVAGIFAGAGQTCVAGSRLLVQEGIYDQVVREVSLRADSIQLGDPKLPTTDMGPIANRPQYERITATIQAGLDGGARRVAGETLKVEAPQPNLFVAPTVFADVDNQSLLAREEIFGPVLSVIPFVDADHAIAIANDSDYGLAAGVWTNTLGLAHRMARDLVAGTVWINTYRAAAAQAPFGGTGSSGYGRERGEESLREYVRTKNVMVDISTSTSDSREASS